MKRKFVQPGFGNVISVNLQMILASTLAQVVEQGCKKYLHHLSKEAETMS